MFLFFLLIEELKNFQKIISLKLKKKLKNESNIESNHRILLTQEGLNTK